MPEYSLALWHGFTAPLAMSLVALAGGIVAYVAMRRRPASRRFMRRLLLPGLEGRRVFAFALRYLARGARAISRWSGTRRLQPQMFLMVAIAVVSAWAALREGGIAWGDRPRVPATIEFGALWAIGMACAVGAAWQAKFHRLAALVMLAVTGLATCLTFVWFSAPDLALTQLAVEVVTTTLFLLGLRWLPKRLEGDDPRIAVRARMRRGRDLVLALAAGGGMAALAHAMLTRPAPQSISHYYLERALPEGGGTNVINVMLVDFRGFDTLGEITVLAAVALTVHALLRRSRPPRESAAPPRQQLVAPASTDLDIGSVPGALVPGYLLVASVLARLALPIAGLVAAYLFLRGHDQPGGGFVAGLVVAAAFITQYLVAGARWVEERVGLNPLLWIGVGLLLAAGTGAGAMFLGYPFLTTHTAHVALPVVGVVHLPSAMLFDAGVFSVVVGSTLLILVALAHQSIRAQRD